MESTRKRQGDHELAGIDGKRAHVENSAHEGVMAKIPVEQGALKKRLEKHNLEKQARANDNQRSPRIETKVGPKDVKGPDLLAQIRQRKAALSSKLGGMSALVMPESATKPMGLGLNTPVHPMLLEKTISRAIDNDYGQKNEKPNPYFDASRSLDSDAKKRARGLVFNQRGKYIRQAEELRRQAKLEELKRKVEEKKKETNLGVDLVAGEREYKRAEPPSVEWWDEKLVMKDNQYSDLDAVDLELNPKLTGQNSEISEYILHPIPIPPPWEKHLPMQPSKLHLTKREIKQIRKRERNERHKEKQDRIRLGLDPAPAPKVKPSNVMSIYTDEAIRDPTRMEMLARKELELRKQKHKEDNESRKLSPEQRWEKEQAKIEAQKEKGLYCAVFRIENLSDGKHKFLVNYNALEYKFTGITIFNDKFNLVIVEGGFLQIKKYKKLLLNRVKWTENAPPKTPRDGEEPQPPQDLSRNRCRLVWSGQLKNNHFSRWSQFHAETEQDAKDILARNDAAHYWVEARSLDANGGDNNTTMNDDMKLAVHK